MGAYLEVWASPLPESAVLEGERVTVGSAGANQIALAGDQTVSRLHAALERYGGAWCITDLGSRNGTYVNGERIVGPRALRPGDEIRVGGTRIVFRSEGYHRGSSTHATEPVPELTRRERDVLFALCQPVLSNDLFTGPASIREMAAKLVVTEDAVKKHLGRLYEKFGIHERPHMPRLANEAIRRGAVSFADLRSGGRND